MRLGGSPWSRAVACGALVAWSVLSSGSVRASASEPGAVLVAPLQGSPALRDRCEREAHDAVVRALEARSYRPLDTAPALERALVACQTPECVERTLDAAGADLALVPAVWSSGSGPIELTLTVVRRNEGNRNARGELPELDDLGTMAAALVDGLLSSGSARPVGAPRAGAEHATDRANRRPHAWKAGPAILVAGGTAAFVAIAVGAATKGAQQQLDRAAVAAWSAVGAAAIGSGIAWWVVGDKRRRRAKVAFHPLGIDLRLRF